MNKEESTELLIKSVKEWNLYRQENPYWISNLREADLRDANLRWANLSGADLSEANLRDADLRGADLSGADLSEADLRDANLSGADLSEADLRWANLRWANLRDANLRWANLRWANLSGADLRWANLRDANLSGADLRWANLRDANLRDAKLPHFQIPEGELIVWKKGRDCCLIRLSIPEKAKRTGSLVGRKCRAEYAKVLGIWDAQGKEAKQCLGWRYSRFEYKVGETVKPDKYCDDIRVECSNGIHFFLTKQEAIEF